MDFWAEWWEEVEACTETLEWKNDKKMAFLLPALDSFIVSLELTGPPRNMKPN